jgi:non-heme chloroperoxidase
MSWRALVLLMSAVAASAAADSRLVDVGDGVTVEVLDWGGAGRPVLLLSGSGNTAHIFEDFAPKLIECCRVHVYGITRRGYGASSKPQRGYSTPELAEDDWRVIQALKLQKPVAIGHSMAGSEMTFLAQKHSSDLAALVYLDANADPMDYPWSNAEFRALTVKAMKGAPGPPKRTAADNSSVEAYQAYQRRTGDVPFPAAEIRNMYEMNPDGSVGKNRTPPYVGKGIDDGTIPKDYRGIGIPVLALIAVPKSPVEKWKDHPPKTEEERHDSERSDEIVMEFIGRWENNLKHADPPARVVELPGAHHYIFLAEQTEVLRQIKSFLQTVLEVPIKQGATRKLPAKTPPTRLVAELYRYDEHTNS